jgi:biotin operon repressor
MPVPPHTLAVLASLDANRPSSGAELTAANGASPPAIHKAVSTLRKHGLVYTHREGRSLMVTASSPAIAASARALLFDAPRPDWGTVLRGDRPVFLHALDRIHRPRVAALVCGIHAGSARRIVSTHAKRGLLVHREGGFEINPLLRELRRFVGEWSQLAAAHRLQAVAPRGALLWHVGKDVIFRGEATLHARGLHPAALSAFASHGIILVSNEAPTWILTERAPDARDAILQALLLGSGSIVRSYAAALYEKAGQPDLGDLASLYGVQGEAQQLTQYIQTHKATGYLPWHEHKRILASLEVA